MIDLSSPAEGGETDYTQVEKSKNMEFSKSTTQVMESLRDNWSITMKTLLTSQEQRVRRLEEGFSAVRSSNLRIESLECEIQEACQRLRSVSKKHENMLPGLFSKAQASSLRVKTVKFNVEHRLAEMDNKLQKIMEIGLNSRPLPRVVNDVNSTIIQGAPSMVLKYVSLEIEELAQARYTDRIITEELMVEVLEIQDRIILP